MKKRIIGFITMLSLTFSMSTSYAVIENIEGIDYMDDVYRFDVEGSTTVDNFKMDILIKLGILEDSAENPFNGDEFLKKSEYQNAVLLLMGKSASYAEDKTKVRLADAYEGILDALGYKWDIKDSSADSVQGIADSVGLSKGITLKMNDYITKNDFVDILFNALEADMGSYPIYVKSGPLSDNTPLTNIFNTIKVTGVVNAIEGINLYGSNKVRKGHVEIDRAEYSIGDTNVESHLGCRVKAYAQYIEDKDEFVLLYVERENEKNSLIMNFEDIYECNSSKLKYLSHDESEKTVNISNVKTVIYNGQYMTGVKLSDVIEESDGRLELQTISKGGNYEMAIVWTYRYFVVDIVDLEEEVIRLKYGAMYNGKNYIPISDSSRVRIFMNGTVIDWKELITNDVIRVMSTYDGSYMEFDTSRTVLRGNVTSVDDSDNTVKISDNIYKVSEDYNECLKNSSSGLKKIKVGMTGTFYISSDGKIVGFKEGSQYSFGYLKNIIYDEENDIYRIKYLSQEGDWRNTKLADKIVVDGKKIAAEDAGKILLQNKNEITENIFRYKSNGIDVINGNDSLVFVDTMCNTEDEKNDTEKMNYCGSFENFMNFRCIYLIGSNYQLSTDTVIFRVPDNLDKEEDFAVIKNTELPWGDESVKVPLKLYNPNRYYLVGAAIYKGGEEAVGSEGFILIEKISEVFDEEEEDIAYKVKGLYLNGGVCEEREYTVTKSVAEKLKSFESGDFNRYAVNGDKISGIMDFFCSGWTLPEPKSIYRYHDYHYISGTVIERDPENNLLVVDYGNSNIAVTRITNKVAVMDKTGGSPKARVSDFSSIQVGDKVFFYDIYAYSNWCIVMKE